MTRTLAGMALAGLLLAATTRSAVAAPDIHAMTSTGPMIGVSSDGIDRFLGVPYAAPPVGALRLRPPQPHAPWAAPRLATAYGAPCPQDDALGTPSTSEDCLTLNVFRPTGPSGARPIVVFLYGGAFLYGSAGTGPQGGAPNYDGGALARRIGSIVVTVNYRLGALGFLAAPALDAESAGHVSGNYGLLDQQAALSWVRRNAAALGGDAGRITLWGQSAGALSVIDQMVSPMARGLFSAAQIDSAGAIPDLTLGAAERADQAFLERNGCAGTGDEAACLRALPVAAFIADAHLVRTVPVIDGWAIPQPPAVLLAAGGAARIPVIEGSNLDDGGYFIARLESVGAPDAGRWIDLLRKAFGDAAAAEVASHYPIGAGTTPGASLAAILTDEFFACPALRLRETLQSYQPVLQYEFAQQPDPVWDYPRPTAPRDFALGAAHTTELAYIFAHDGEDRPLSGDDLRLSDAMDATLALLTRLPSSPIGGAEPRGVVEWKDAPVLDEDFSSRHQCDFWRISGIKPTLF